MRSEIPVLRFFGLTTSEHRILRALPKKGSVSISELSRRTHLSRTTTRENLYRLHARGMVRKARVAGDIQWKCPSAAVFERRIAQGARMLGAYTDRTAASVKVRHALHVSEKVDVTVIRGAHKLFEVYAHAYAGRPDERVLLTQFSSGFKAMREKISSAYMKKANSIGTQHRGILEMIMTENTKKEYARLAYSDEKWAENAAQRRVDISVVPEELFTNQKSELFIFRSSVLLTDWEAETGILIENEELAHMLQSFFRATKQQGTSFDNASFLKMIDNHLTRFRQRNTSSQSTI